MSHVAPAAFTTLRRKPLTPVYNRDPLEVQIARSEAAKAKRQRKNAKRRNDFFKCCINQSLYIRTPQHQKSQWAKSIDHA